MRAKTQLDYKKQNESVGEMGFCTYKTSFLLQTWFAKKKGQNIDRFFCYFIDQTPIVDSAFLTPHQCQTIKRVLMKNYLIINLIPIQRFL